jgi:hypothetical protein
VPELEIRHPEKQDSAPNGAVLAVSVEGKHRFSKLSRPSITLTSGHGIEGDAHSGPFVRHRYLARRDPKAPNLRQVHLIPSELFDALRTSGFAQSSISPIVITTVRSRTFPSRSLKITSRCPSSRNSAAFASASLAVSTMTPTAPTPLRAYTW